MDVVDWVILGVVGASLLGMWIAQVVDKNCTIRDQDKALETFADLVPELREVFSDNSYHGNKAIRVYKVMEYLNAKKSVQASDDAEMLVEDVTKLFKK